MLSEKEQTILCELLFYGKMTRDDLLKINLLSNDTDFFKTMHRLQDYGLVEGSHFWRLTFKGSIFAKLLVLLPNRKDYSKNLRNEIIEFGYYPHD